MADATKNMDSNHRISDYNPYLNTISKRRIKFPFPYPIDGSVFVSSGFPNPSTFPITKGQFTLRDGETLYIPEEEMKQMLQYGLTIGNQDLIDWLIELQRRLHNPPLLDHKGEPSSMDLIMTTGCTDGISKVFEATLEEGNTLLTEGFTYPCVFNATIPMGVKTCPIKSDGDGMLPDMLDDVLNKWNPETDGKKPHLLYCVPSAANPTGVTWSMERKEKIYKIARKHSLLILEDDPYFLIQYNQPRLPGFLSLDTDGRVIRLDSFTKVMSAGARLGYISGPTFILERIIQHVVTTTYHPGNISQIFILKVLQHMGYDGYLQHGDKIANFYKERAEKACKAAEKHLKGLAEWKQPDGGMFLWMHMLGVKDSTKVVAKTLERGAIFTDGAFFASGMKPSEYIRMSFSVNSDEEFEKAMAILATVLREEQKED